MMHISLFSGIGGFELAAEWLGWRNIASCEINEFGRRVLKHYWSHAYHHDDIYTLTHEVIDEQLTRRYGADWRSDDIILTGGFPCQPYSAAGKRQGKEDDRHLWPQMLRVIREVRPTWVVGENVLGLVNWNGGLVFDEVQADLEAEGYEVQPYVLPAAAVNAPHRRDRVWFVAYSEREPIEQKIERGRGKCRKERTEVGQINSAISKSRPTPDTSIIGRNYGGDNWQERHVQTNIGTTKEDQPKRYGRQRRISKACSVSTNDATETTSTRGRQNNGKGKSKLYDKKSPSGNWQNFPTQSPICSGDDGLPTKLDGITVSKCRNESIKAYGNAIVPQVAYQIFKAIQHYEDQQ